MKNFMKGFVMTTRDKHQLLELLNRYDREELDCDGECNSCFYFIKAQRVGMQNCPLLAAYDMIYEKIFHPNIWDERKG